MDEVTPNQLVMLTEAAFALGVPAAWLKDEADARRVPFLQVGRRRLFSVEGVRRALAVRAGERGIIELSGLKEAAKRVGLDPAWLKEDAESGAVQAYRHNGTLLFDVPELERSLLNRARAGRTPEEDGRG